MRRYLDLLSVCGFAGLFLAQLVARSPIGLWSIGLLLFTRDRVGSYAAAGLITAMLTVGRAVGTPVVSRAVGRWGPRRVLAASALGSAIAAAAVVIVDLSALPLPVMIAGYAVLTSLCGLFTPPVQPVVRALFPHLLPADALSRAYSLDAAAQEVIFVVGPLVAFGIAGVAGPAWTIVAGLVLLLGGIGWILTVDGLDAAPRRPVRARFGTVLVRPVVLAGAVVSLLLVAANSAVEAAVVAAFGSEGITGGLLLAVYSASSLVGGLVLVRWVGGRWAQAGWLAVVSAGLGLTVASLTPGWLAVALGLAGIGVAPVFAAVAWQVSRGVDDPARTEAFGWIDTGAIAGASLGFAAAGVVIDTAAATGGFVLAAGLAGAACLLALVAGGSAAGRRQRARADS